MHSDTGIVGIFTVICDGIGRALDNRRIVLAMAAFLLLGGLAAQLSGTLNHDTAWYLATGKFADGARLYVDIVEVNPPLAFYLTVPAVVLARHADLFPVHAFIVYVFGVISVSLLIAWRLPRQDANLPSASRHGILLAALFGFAIYPAGSFGQREHLMLVLAFPYLIATALRARRRMAIMRH